MFFQVYGANALPQWGMMLVVLAGLILLNEFARRTKFGGIFTFLVVPVALTAYFLAIYARLVPLCQALCSHSWVYRLYDD